MLIGITSVPPDYGYCSLDPDQCATTPASQGTFSLDPGYHSITIYAVLNPYNYGAAYFRIDGDIPSEPPPPPDSDGDGIPDNEDQCMMSDLSPTVIVADCDSGVANTLYENGCTIADQIQECGNGVRNHGLRVSCVADLLNQLMKDDEIKQKGAIQSCVAQDN